MAASLRNKLISALLLTGAVLAATSALAQETARPGRLYLAGYLGLTMPRDSGFTRPASPVSGEFKFDNGISLAGALGLRISPNIRIEAELDHHENDLSSVTLNNGTTLNQLGTVTGTTYMANVYYDFNRQWRNLTPFVTFGIGAVNNDVSLGANGALMPAASDDTWDVAWQVGAGVKYKMSDNTSMTGGYRYIDMGQVEGNGYTFDNNAHEIRIGLEYSLPVMWGK